MADTRAGLAARWREVLRTGNPPAGHLDAVSRWLVLTRAAVLPMTITAGGVGGLLAVNRADFDLWPYLLALAGITSAHVANNLMNDLFDLDVGTDTASYPRALYAPHPVLSGMVTRSGLASAALLVNAVGLAILVGLALWRGWPVLVFGVAGFVLSVAYTAPPLRLKKHGLGELDVLVVWGPLMVGGTYYAATGHVSWPVMAASLPYALLCTSVLMGKHIDKAPWDARTGTRTLPVILGDPPARTVAAGLMIASYACTVGLVLAGALPWPALLMLASLGALWKALAALRHPRPAEAPEGFPVWPLWFAAIAFVHTRRAGALLVLGLAIGAGLGY